MECVRVEYVFVCIYVFLCSLLLFYRVFWYRVFYVSFFFNIINEKKIEKAAKETLEKVK